MEEKTYYTYLFFEGAELFTVVCLPKAGGQFPTILHRRPYVDDCEALEEGEICRRVESEHDSWLRAGYAVVYQHCRGRGKSGGDCVPYIYEREDSLFLQQWVREQPFYNGELFLYGQSYTSSVHFTTAPFAKDIKGAILEVQDCERYNCNYRNGFFKVGLHGGWYVGMYKRKSMPQKNYQSDSYRMLPLSDFSQTVFGERAADFDEILRHPDRSDPFWDTRFGGGEAHNAIKHADIPILLITGFYDIYTGGVFDMWQGLDRQTKEKSALAVHPFDHSGLGKNQPIDFRDGVLADQFPDYRVRWMDAARGLCESPFEKGKVTYYSLFEEAWRCDDFYDAEEVLALPLGKGSVGYTYNPASPAVFRGGLSANFGGCAWQNPPNSSEGIVTLYTDECKEDTYIKGKIKATLTVCSDRPDTCFYMRLSLVKSEGDYGLRDDINQISNFDADYQPNTEIQMDFSFDEHAFWIKKGEKLRIDISSSAWPHYVPHTNCRGLFSEQKEAAVAHNTVMLKKSSLRLPIKGKTK